MRSHLVPASMRCCFTRHGDRKVKFSEREAHGRAALYGQYAYKCPTCKGWHLASVKR